MPHPLLTWFFPGTRRGFALWLASLALIVRGFANYVVTAAPDSAQASLSFALQISRGSVPLWGWVMIAVGVFTGFWSYNEKGHDWFGHLAMCVFAGAWGLAHVAGVFYGMGPRALGDAAIWLMIAGVFSVIAGFPNIRVGNPPPFFAPDSDTPTGRTPG